MKLLLDSHTLLCAIYAPHMLTDRVAELLSDKKNELIISRVPHPKLAGCPIHSSLLAMGGHARHARTALVSQTNELTRL